MTSKRAEDLTFADMALLLKSWADSYYDNPPAAAATLKSSLSYLGRYMVEVTGQLLRHRLIRKADLPTLMDEASAKGVAWATLCFAVGLEGALANIDNSDVPFYLSACEQPFRVYIFGFLGRLLLNKKIKERYAKRIGEELSSYLTKNSVFLANQGWLYHQSVKPKYKGKQSPLALELLSIDITGLRASYAFDKKPDPHER